VQVLHLVFIIVFRTSSVLLSGFFGKLFGKNSHHLCEQLLLGTEWYCLKYEQLLFAKPNWLWSRMD